MTEQQINQFAELIVKIDMWILLFMIFFNLGAVAFYFISTAFFNN